MLNNVLVEIVTGQIKKDKFQIQVIGALINSHKYLEPFLKTDTNFENIAACIKTHFPSEIHLQNLESVEVANDNLGHIRQWFSMNDYSLQRVYNDIKKFKKTG